MRLYFSFRVATEEPEGLYERALRIAVKHGRPTVYDCQYVALADMKKCELWTADERLFNALRDAFPLIRYLRHFRP